MKIIGKQDQVTDRQLQEETPRQGKWYSLPQHMEPTGSLKGKTVPVCSPLLWDMQATLVHRRISEEAH